MTDRLDAPPATRELIGTVQLHRPLGTYRAVCADRKCGWTWTGSRMDAEERLRSHVSHRHPQPIHIYRETG